MQKATNTTSDFENTVNRDAAVVEHGQAEEEAVLLVVDTDSIGCELVTARRHHSTAQPCLADWQTFLYLQASEI